MNLRSTIVLVCFVALVCGTTVYASLDELFIDDVNIAHNGQLYPLSPQLVDPNQINLVFSGGAQDGLITLHVANPHTLNVSGQLGKDVQDITIVIASDGTTLELVSYTNNPSPYAFGTVSDVIVSGTWKGRVLRLNLSYWIKVPRGSVVSYVSVSVSFVGEVTRKTGVFVGEIRGITRVSYTLSPTSISRQILGLYGLIDTSSPSTSIMVGYSALSPYTSNCTVASPAPYYVAGNATDFVLDNGTFTAHDLNLEDEFDKINLTGADIRGEAYQLQRRQPMVYVSYGIVTASNGITKYLATNWRISPEA